MGQRWRSKQSGCSRREGPGARTKRSVRARDWAGSTGEAMLLPRALTQATQSSVTENEPDAARM